MFLLVRNKMIIALNRNITVPAQAVAPATEKRNGDLEISYFFLIGPYDMSLCFNSIRFSKYYRASAKYPLQEFASASFDSLNRKGENLISMLS